MVGEGVHEPRIISCDVFDTLLHRDARPSLILHQIWYVKLKTIDGDVNALRCQEQTDHQQPSDQRTGPEAEQEQAAELGQRAEGGSEKEIVQGRDADALQGRACGEYADQHQQA